MASAPRDARWSAGLDVFGLNLLLSRPAGLSRREESMFFTVINAWAEAPPNPHDAAFLVVDYWDDWFSYRTMFTLWIFDEQGVRHRIGSVKIGQYDLLPAPGNPPPPPGAR